MAAGVNSFPKTVGSSLSRQDPILMYSYLPAGGGIEVQNASSLLSAPAFLLPNCRKLSDRDTDPIGNGTEGISDVTFGANGMEEEIPTIVSGICKTVTPRTDVAEGTGCGWRISSTTPPYLILSLGTLKKIKTRHDWRQLRPRYCGRRAKLGEIKWNRTSVYISTGEYEQSDKLTHVEEVNAPQINPRKM